MDANTVSECLRAGCVLPMWGACGGCTGLHEIAMKCKSTGRPGLRPSILEATAPAVVSPRWKTGKSGVRWFGHSRSSLLPRPSWKQSLASEQQGPSSPWLRKTARTCACRKARKPVQGFRALSFQGDCNVKKCAVMRVEVLLPAQFLMQCSHRCVLCPGWRRTSY